MSAQQETGDRLLAVTAVADRLGCSRGHVYGLIAAGDLSAVDIKPTGSTRTKTRVLASEVNGLIAARTRKAS